MEAYPISDEAREAAKDNYGPPASAHGIFVLERHEKRIQLAINSSTAKLVEENKRLREGKFTPEEFQNLCHNRDKDPLTTEEDFFIGCAEYQKKLFGHCEREQLQTQIHGLREALQELGSMNHNLECPKCPACELVEKALSSTTDFSKEFVRREILKQCAENITIVLEERTDFKKHFLEEALTLARKELEEK